jgi:hypothetical protein
MIKRRALVRKDAPVGSARRGHLPRRRLHATGERGCRPRAREPPWRNGARSHRPFVEQKNGAVVRRLVGYGRFEGVETARVMARLYRRYVLLGNRGMAKRCCRRAAAAVAGGVLWIRMVEAASGNLVRKGLDDQTAALVAGVVTGILMAG